MNPNNCATCDHKKHPDGGWCYMFRDEPKERCAQHTMSLLRAHVLGPRSPLPQSGQE